MNGFVYVAQSECGRIKIGTSYNPRERVRTISSYSPTLVRLIATWPGSYGNEAALHKRLEPSRHHCEWFEPTSAVLEFVDEVFGRGVTHVPEFADMKFAPRSKHTAWITRANAETVVSETAQ